MARPTKGTTGHRSETWVLWLALAALMAVVILGAATLSGLQPTLTAEIRSGTQIALPIQHSPDRGHGGGPRARQ